AARIVDWYDISTAIFTVQNPFGRVVAVLGFEIEITGGRSLTGADTGIEDSALLQAGASRRIHIDHGEHTATAIGQVAGTFISPSQGIVTGVGYEATGVGPRGRDTASAGINRVRPTVEIAFKIIPAQFPHYLVAQRVVGRLKIGARQVHLADDGIYIATLFEQLGCGHLVG